MPVDPMLPLQVNNETVPNPMDFLQHMQNLRQRQNQNLLFQQENDARVGIGQAYRKALGPDGEIDARTLLEEIAKNPATAFKMPEAAADVLARDKAQQEVMAAKVAGAKQRMALLGEGLGALKALGNGVGPSDVYDVASRLITQVGDKKFTADLLTSLKQMPKDGPALAKWVDQHHLQALTAVQQMELTNPTPGQVDRGGHVDIVQMPRIGDTTPRTLDTIVRTPTTEQMNRPNPKQGKEGEPMPPVPAVQIQPMFDANGRQVTAPAPGAADTPLGPPPAVVQGSIQNIEDFNKYRVNLDDRIASGEQTLRQIASIQPLLEQTRTGGGSDKRLALAKLAQAFGAPDDVVGTITGGDVGAAETFAKKTLDMAFSELKAAIPPGTQITNSEVMAKWRNSPQLEMDPRAIENIFNFSKKTVQYFQEEREFLMKWDGRPKDARAAWTREALKRGLLENATSANAQAPALGGSTVLRRGAGVPADIPLDQVPADGRVRTFQNESGQTIKLRRRGSEIEVVAEPMPRR